MVRKPQCDDVAVRNLLGLDTENAPATTLGLPADVMVGVLRQAVAAAILGNPDAVEYVPLTAGEREEALNSGRVDVTSRNTTLQLTRDTLWNATFGPVVLYDGQGIMTRSKDRLDTLGALTGRRVCSIEGTVSIGNFRAEMEARGLAFEKVTFPDLQVVLANFFQENCDAP